MTDPAPLVAIVTQLRHRFEGCDDAEVAIDPDGSNCIRLVRGREQVSVAIRDGAWWVRRTPSEMTMALCPFEGQPLRAGASPEEVAEAIHHLLWSDLERGYLQAIAEQLDARYQLHAEVEDDGGGPYLLVEYSQAQDYLVAPTGKGWQVLLPEDRELSSTLALGEQVLTTRAAPEAVADAISHLLLALQAIVERLRARHGLHAVINGPDAGTLSISITRTITTRATGEGWAVTEADGHDIHALRQADGHPLPAGATPDEIADAIGHLLGVAVTPDFEGLVHSAQTAPPPSSPVIVWCAARGPECVPNGQRWAIWIALLRLGRTRTCFPLWAFAAELLSQRAQQDGQRAAYWLWEVPDWPADPAEIQAVLTARPPDGEMRCDPDGTVSPGWLP